MMNWIGGEAGEVYGHWCYCGDTISITYLETGVLTFTVCDIEHIWPSDINAVAFPMNVMVDFSIVMYTFARG